MDGEAQQSESAVNGGRSEFLLSEAADRDLSPGWKFWKRRRNLMGMLTFFGFFYVYTLRVNYYIAVESISKKQEDLLPDGTFTYGPDFDWEVNFKNFILSSFFFFMLTQLPGAWLALRFGGSKIFGFSIALLAILTLMPVLLGFTDKSPLIVVRSIESLLEGLLYPSIYTLLGKWTPPLERSKFAALPFCGAWAGLAFMNVISVAIHDSSRQYLLYVLGVMGIIWFVIWYKIVKEGPELDPRTTSAELNYIQDSLGKKDRVGGSSSKIPWKAILRSKPVWALVAVHFAWNWGFYTLLTIIPIFHLGTYYYHMPSTGIIYTLQYVGMCLMLLLASYAADKLRYLNISTTTKVRKLFCCGALLLQSIFLLATIYCNLVDQHQALSSIAAVLGGYAWSAICANYLDMSPQYAGVLIGLSNTVATLPALLLPILLKVIAIQLQRDERPPTFYTSVGIYLAGAIIYYFWGSGKSQYWTKDPTEDDIITHSTDTSSKRKEVMKLFFITVICTSLILLLESMPFIL